jgi:D-glycerate 3-kinase
MDRGEFTLLLARWLEAAVEGAPMAGRPLIIGLSGPQGVGKTTLMREICRACTRRGCRTASISIDDFYLTHAEQLVLARRHPDNRFVQHRGYPGTHDVDLGVRVLTALKSLASEASVELPVYDRSAHAGAGDRLPVSDWRRIEGPLDLVVLEGWMLGFTPVAAADLADPDLRLVNDFLAEYAAGHALLDGFGWLEPEDHLYVRAWRVEAEERSIAAGRAGMSPGRIAQFVEAFLPAYAIWTPGLRARPPTKGAHLHVIVGRDRLPREILSTWHR